jgi:hypothetical protein
VDISFGYRFTSASSEAAVLTLPEGAARQNLSNITRFRHYAIKNALRWYEFVNNTLGREAPNGSLYLVTGCDKSTTWGIASASSASETNSISLRFTAAKTIAAGAMYTYSWQTSCPATVRIGPNTCDNPNPPQNQCNFLRGFKISIREGPMAAIKGSAKVAHNVNSNSGNIPPGSKCNYVSNKDASKYSEYLSGRGSRAHHSGRDQQRATRLHHFSDTEDKHEDVILESEFGATEVNQIISASIRG